VLDDVVQPHVRRTAPAERRDRADVMVADLVGRVLNRFELAELAGPRADELSCLLFERHPVEEVLDPVRESGSLVSVKGLLAA